MTAFLSKDADDDEVRLESGYRHLSLDRVGSTNSVCLEKARAGDPGCLWVTASSQEQGRGRQDRVWISKPGNLYASLLLVDPAHRSDLGSLPLVVSLAVHDALLSAAPVLAGRLAIKWPNDILYDGAKLSGILLESTMVGKSLAVVIGCGVNCRRAPPPGEYAVTCLQELDVPVAPEDLFPHLASAMAARLGQWDRGVGKARVIDDWIARAGGLGEPIRVRLPDRTVSGVFSGLDGDGFLLLAETGDVISRISAGDVFFGSADRKRTDGS